MHSINGIGAAWLSPLSRALGSITISQKHKFLSTVMGEGIQIKGFGESSFQGQIELKKSLLISALVRPLNMLSFWTPEHFTGLSRSSWNRSAMALLEMKLKRRDLLLNIWQTHQTTDEKLTPDHVKNGIYGVLRARLAFQRDYNTSRSQDSLRARGSYLSTKV